MELGELGPSVPEADDGRANLIITEMEKGTHLDGRCGGNEILPNWFSSIEPCHVCGRSCPMDDALEKNLRTLDNMMLDSC